MIVEVSNNGLITKNIKLGTGLSNLATRLKLLKIGYLDKKIQNDKMIFIIKLKK